MSALDELSLVPGHGTAPRFGTPRRPARPTRGGLDAQVAALLGWNLFPWQQHVVDVAGEYDPITRIPRYRTVGVGVSRQNGKTSLVCVRIARALIPNRQTVAYTAQDRSIAHTKWAEHVEVLMGTPFADRVAHVDRTNHREMLVLHNGSRYMPVTPTARKAARSLSIDLAVIDEAHAHESMGVIGAIGPTMATRPHAQLWVLSNAGGPTSQLWRHYTETGRAEIDKPDSSMCWFEWAAEPDADIADRSAWAAANPSMDLPGGVLPSALADGALTLDVDTFRREHLNVWVEGSSLSGIDPIVWAACRRDDLAPGTRVALSLDFTPERDRGALVAVGEVEGVTPLEVIDTGTDLHALITRCTEIALRWDCPVVLDRGGPASSAIPFVEQAGAKVRLISLVDVARACGDFYDAATFGRLSHRGDFRLSDAVAAASKRKVGDGWVWQRRGGFDISPLVAATLARWGVVSTDPGPEPMIF